LNNFLDTHILWGESINALRTRIKKQLPQFPIQPLYIHFTNFLSSSPLGVALNPRMPTYLATKPVKMVLLFIIRNL